jgi:hypothetical protein
MNKIQKKVIFCSILKNEEKNLEKFFLLIKSLKEIFDDYFIILVESESTDNTVKLAKKYLLNLKGTIISKDTSIYRKRTEKTAYCRNEYLKFIKNNNRLMKFNYLIILDGDKINHLINKKKLLSAIANTPMNWTAIFSNQLLFYYDLWTLRIKHIFNFDCFENLNKLSKIDEPKLIFKNIFLYGINLIRKSKKRFLKVQSAFGGFAIYKLEKAIKFKYSSNNGKYCEHVLFNLKIHQKYGNLYIDKKLTNSFGINIHTINIILCSCFNFFAKRFIKKLSSNSYYVHK